MNAQEEFDDQFNKAYEEKAPDLDNHINCAMVGKVSTGKSSLINAIFERDRTDPIAEVGAHSGVTNKITHYKFGNEVLIIDCPGLDDVRAENSDETKNFLAHIDLGIFVVTGSADESQRANFEDLKRHVKNIIVVLNKVDEWDDLDESAYIAVADQWKSVLGTDKIFPTCTKGYDPKMRKDAPMDIRGVDELRQAIFNFLDLEKKSILFARHLKHKENYAISIISAALVSVAAEAFIPGSAAYITATQIVAITSLNYLYTGNAISKTSALLLLPTFVGENIGMNAFLWAKSLLPPTGIVDMAAALIAVVITFAMLAAVKWVLENGNNLDQSDKLKEGFLKFRSVGNAFKDLSISDFKNKKAVYNLIRKLLSKA